MKIKKKHMKHLYFVLFLILFSVIFTYPLYNLDNSKAGSDFRNGDTPAYHFIDQYLEEKTFPLWDRLTFGGRPMAGMGQPLLYPPAILLSLFFNPYSVMNILLIFHVLLAGIGMYFLTYYLTKNRQSSVISAAVYMFSPYMMTALLRHPFWVAGIAYIPLEFLIVKLAIDKKEYKKYAIWLGIILSLHFLSGGVLQWYFSIWLVVGYLSYSMIGNFKKGLKAFFIVCIFLLIMFCLIAPRLLPGQEFTSFTNRAGLSKAEIKQVGYVNADNFIYKFIYPIGQTKEGNTSYGVLGLGRLLMLFGLWKGRKHKFVIFLFLMMLGMFIYSTGVLLDLFYLIPGVSSQRGLDRSLIIFVVCASVMSGIGYNYLPKKKYMFYIILTLVIGSLFVLNIKQINFQNSKFEDYKITESNPLFLKIAEDDDIFRFHVAEVRGIDWNDFLGASIPLKLESVYGTYGGGFDPRYFNQFLGASMQQPIKMWGILNVKYIISNKEINSSELELVDRYDINSRTVSHDNYKDGNAYLYKNKQFLPRVLIPKEIILVNDKNKMYNVMLNENYNPFNMLVIKHSYEKFISSNGGTANIIEYKPNYMKVEVNNNDTTYLFISEKFTLYPGWTAKVDGRNTNILLANGVLSAIQLPANSKIVEFKYMPQSFVGGMILASLCILILMFLSIKNKYIYKG